MPVTMKKQELAALITSIPDDANVYVSVGDKLLIIEKIELTLEEWNISSGSGVSGPCAVLVATRR